MGADYFAPGETIPLSEKGNLKPPIGIYEVAGSYGFNVSAADFTAAKFVAWFKTNSPIGYTLFNNLSGGDFGALKMGSLQSDPTLGDPIYPFQVAPFSSLSATQTAYNNTAIQAQLDVYNSKLPNISSDKILWMQAQTLVVKSAIIGNYIALSNATALSVMSQLGFSLNPADGFVYALAVAWLQSASPAAYSALDAQLSAIAKQEVSAADASSAKTLSGLYKFAAAIVLTIATAGIGSPALAAALKSGGAIASSLGANPALAGTPAGQALSGIGGALNPTPLQQFQIWAAANPGEADIIYVILALVGIFIVYKIAKR